MKRETLLVAGVGILSLLAIAAFLVLSPAGGDLGRREVSGPPTVRPEVAAAHAAQFDELGPRPAGSQREEAAAVFLLGMFQRNGYVVRLESVPVRDLVSSTDLIASPPGVDDASTLVVAGYGAGEKGPGTGPALGVMLEVSRALNVADPDHTVGFVALGGEFTGTPDGALGSRRLIKLLLDEGRAPTIVQLVQVGDGVTAASSGPDRVFGGGDEVTVEPDLFAAAGFTRYLVSGPLEEIGRSLLRGLQRLQQ